MIPCNGNAHNNCITLFFGIIYGFFFNNVEDKMCNRSYVFNS